MLLVSGQSDWKPILADLALGAPGFSTRAGGSPYAVSQDRPWRAVKVRLSDQPVPWLPAG